MGGKKHNHRSNHKSRNSHLMRHGNEESSAKREHWLRALEVIGGLVFGGIALALSDAGFHKLSCLFGGLAACCGIVIAAHYLKKNGVRHVKWVLVASLVATAFLFICLALHSHSNEKQEPSPSPSKMAWMPPELPPGCKSVSITSGNGNATSTIGENGWGSGLINLFAVGSDVLVRGEVISNRFYINAKIPGTQQFGAFKISGITINGQIPPNWDMNYDATAIEIVDHAETPIYQIVYKRPNVVEVYGAFEGGGRIMLTTRDGCEVIPVMQKDGTPVNINPASLKLKRIFKYPSLSYQGQRVQYND